MKAEEKYLKKFVRSHTCETVQDVIKQKEKKLNQRMGRK